MNGIAPYAETAIALSLGSITGLKYREYSCIECGNQIVERNNDRVILYTRQMHSDAKTDSDGNIPTICDHCEQRYLLTITFQSILNPVDNLPLYMHPQTLFVSVASDKKLRDVHCIECGHAFYSVSDRVNMIADNAVPFEALDMARLGPMEARCHFQRCKQYWRVMA